MATALDEKLTHLREKVSIFAAEIIAPRSSRLRAHLEFPFDIWRRMATEQLLGIGIPEQYGGFGGTYRAISVAGEALVSGGHNMGLSLSWTIHQVIARFLLGEFGNESQCGTYLPAMATGANTAAVAISEPEAKAHPKYMSTSASMHDGYYLLNGTKSFLTNGPIADFFVVCAITGTGNDNRKDFSAFIVPKSTEGVSITKFIEFEFLRPSPHCEITLSGCRVPEAGILGVKNQAYDSMIKPFRDVEEVCLMGSVVGGMAQQLALLVTRFRAAPVPASDGLKLRLGHLQSILDMLRIAAYEAAHMLDSGIRHPEFLSLLLSFRYLAGDFQESITHLLSEITSEPYSEFSSLSVDVSTTVGIAAYVARIKQQKHGEQLLAGKE